MKTTHSTHLLERHHGLQRAERSLARSVMAHLCLVDLRTQRGCEQDWDRLVQRIAYGVQLARTHFQEEAVLVVYRALTTLTQIHSTAPGRASLWYATSREASILGPALALTDEMEELCNSKEIALAWHAAQATLD